MNAHQYSRLTREDGSVVLVHFDPKLALGEGGLVRRDFPDAETFDAWWYLNARPRTTTPSFLGDPLYPLRDEVPFDAAEASEAFFRSVNRLGLLRRAAERVWLAANARFHIGDAVEFRSDCFHVAEGATATVVAVDLDHNHTSGHTDECWRAERIQYAVALDYDPVTGKATLRWNARESELRAARRAPVSLPSISEVRAFGERASRAVDFAQAERRFVASVLGARLPPSACAMPLVGALRARSEASASFLDDGWLFRAMQIPASMLGQEDPAHGARVALDLYDRKLRGERAPRLNARLRLPAPELSAVDLSIPTFRLSLPGDRFIEVVASAEREEVVVKAGGADAFLNGGRTVVLALRPPCSCPDAPCPLHHTDRGKAWLAAHAPAPLPPGPGGCMCSSCQPDDGPEETCPVHGRAAQPERWSPRDGEARGDGLVWSARFRDWVTPEGYRNAEEASR